MRSRSTTPRTAQSTTSLAKRSATLTVSDMEGFAEAGGMVELLDNGGRVVLALNIDAAKTAGLKVSRAAAAAQRIFANGRWVEVR